MSKPLPTQSELLKRIEETIGKKVMSAREIERGYSPAKRLVVTCEDGSSLFAKIGMTPETSGWLRKERRTYDTLFGRFMPRFLGWHNDVANPILLLEDLSDAHWPPPWNTEQIDLVLSTLERMWRSNLRDVPRLTDYGRVLIGWTRVAADPEPFLSLGLASEAWLDAALPTLLAFDGQEVAKGDSLLHLDIRSDNLCIDGLRPVLVDWNNVCRGNARFDLGAWLPSLHAEGGPPPETLLPDAPEIAALISGYFASNAGLPKIAAAPHVRAVQLVQLRSALPWAVRALGLPPLDGGRL